MFAKSALLISIIQAASLLSSVEARIWILERDGRAIYARRFSQEQPAVLKEIAAACGGGTCDTLAGEAVTPLLAAQPECSQQDMADKIIDTSRQFDPDTQTKMISAAVKYRQAEKNTPPDFTTNPPSLRNSVFCQKAPANSELDGLVQAQDPANDPNLFFDPATKATVTLGSQPNTFPFGTNGDGVNPPANSTDPVDGGVDNPPTNDTHMDHGGDDGGEDDGEDDGDDVNDGTGNNNGTDTGNLGNFGSCSVPQIEFGQGFDGRKETSFKPVDQKSYTHGSAQNIDVITRSMCDQLVNTCKADDTARNTCANAITAASNATPVKTGVQADAFNAVFGITTNFADDPVFDNQGRIVSGDINNGNGNGNNDADGGNNGNHGGNIGGNNGSCIPVDGGNNNDNKGGNGGNNDDDNNNKGGNGGKNGNNKGGNGGNNGKNNKGGNGGHGGNDNKGGNGGNNGTIGNFGSCSVPEIEFGAGFDNRRETSFQPVDLVSYNHGSAQNFDIIGQFVCDQLVNKCGADATARATCAQARTAAGNAPPKTGKQADAFNAVFGKVTDFASVDPLDNQGKVITTRRAILRRFVLRMVDKYL